MIRKLRLGHTLKRTAGGGFSIDLVRSHTTSILHHTHHAELAVLFRRRLVTGTRHPGSMDRLQQSSRSVSAPYSQCTRRRWNTKWVGMKATSSTPSPVASTG